MLFNSKKIESALLDLDPDRIYVENIRHLLGTNTRIAKWICKIAVKKGYFEVFYAVECPNESCNRIIKSYSSINDIPNKVTCALCKDENLEDSTFDKKSLNIIPYYKYVRGSYNFA
tara:strand:+ start:450 stop:797 length:348 start_codon:yes stop_codon:yes gene_type:complete